MKIGNASDLRGRWSPAWVALLRQSAPLRVLAVGEFVNATGDDIFFVAITAWIITFTGSVAALSGAVIALVATHACFGFVAGAIADRIDRRKIIIASDIGRAMVVAVLPTLLPRSLLAGLILMVLLYVGALFYKVGVSALIPSILPQKDLATGNALYQTILRIGDALGGVSAGAIIAVAGFNTVFYVDAATFLASAFCVWRMPVAWRVGLGTRPPRKMATEVGQGLRYIWRTPIHRVLALLILPGYLTLAFDVLRGPMVVTTAGLSVFAYGVTNSVIGIGKLFSAAVLTGTAKRWASPQFSAVMFVFTAMTILAFGMTTSYPVFIITSFLFGAGNFATNISNSTVSMVNAPTDIIGRLMASRQVFIAGTTILGILLFGRLATVTNPSTALIALGIVSAGGVLMVLFSARREFHAVAAATTAGGGTP